MIWFRIYCGCETRCYHYSALNCWNCCLYVFDRTDVRIVAIDLTKKKYSVCIISFCEPLEPGRKIHGSVPAFDGCIEFGRAQPPLGESIWNYRGCCCWRPKRSLPKRNVRFLPTDVHTQIPIWNSKICIVELNGKTKLNYSVIKFACIVPVFILTQWICRTT